MPLDAEKEAYRRRKRREEYLRSTGRPLLVKGTEWERARARARSFHAQGMTYSQMSRITGIPQRTIVNLAMTSRKGMKRATYTALMAMRFEEPDPTAMVSSVATRRRLAALWRDGFPLPWIAERVGVTVGALRLAPILGPHIPSPLGRFLRMPAVPFSALADPPFAVVHQHDAADAFVAAVRDRLAEPLNIVASGAVTALQAIRRGRRLPVPLFGPDWAVARGLAYLSGAPLPDPHAHHHGGKLMPGMLTADEMARLAAAKGDEFDRLFLELMIKHHEGALVMVKELFASPGAGQESEIFAFASDVDSDQRMEIDRMSAMLAKSKEFEQ